MVKIAVLAPIPSANDSRAATVTPGDFRIIRMPYRKSCINVFISRLQSKGARSQNPESRITKYHLAHEVSVSSPSYSWCQQSSQNGQLLKAFGVRRLVAALVVKSADWRHYQSGDKSPHSKRAAV